MNSLRFRRIEFSLKIKRSGEKSKILENFQKF